MNLQQTRAFADRVYRDARREISAIKSDPRLDEATKVALINVLERVSIELIDRATGLAGVFTRESI